MNHCGHAHETSQEIRRLPVGCDPAHGAVLVCYAHYEQEMRFRHERAKETEADRWEFPSWESLRVDQPAG